MSKLASEDTEVWGARPSDMRIRGLMRRKAIGRTMRRMEDQSTKGRTFSRSGKVLWMMVIRSWSL